MADIIRTEYPDKVDIVMLNTGTLRSNAVVHAGPVKHRLVADLLPMKDKIFLLKVPGHLVMDMFENSIAAYPKLDGRFPAISGITLTFDADKPAGKRITQLLVKDEPLDASKDYVVAVKEYIFLGGDGFTMLQDEQVKVIIEEDCADIIPNLVDAVFRRLSPNYVMNPARKEIRAKRIALFNSSEENKDDKGYIKIAPKVDGRLTILNPKVITAEDKKINE